MFDSIPMEFITLDELCETLIIGKNTAYRLLNTGEIKAFKIGHNWKIPQTSVEQYILQSIHQS